MNPSFARGITILLAPAAVTLGICLLLRVPWRLIALLFLSVPLVASVAELVPPGRGYPVVSTDFVRAVADAYLFALISFGYFPTFLGSIAWRFIRARSSRFTGSTLMSMGILLGALAGLASMLIVVFVGNAQRETTTWAIVGLVAGGYSGLLIAFFLESSHSEPHAPVETHMP
jgi:hypothetical protein